MKRPLRYNVILFWFCLLFFTGVDAQNRKGQFYLYWGYHRSDFSNSDIRVSSDDNYDFTLFDVKAKDVPIRKFTNLFSLFGPVNFRIGYHVSEKMAVSLGMDHMKYEVINNQPVRINGFIDESASPIFAGTYSGDDTIVLSNLLLYLEHTDGLNYVSAEFDYLIYRFGSLEGKVSLDITAGIGIGMMVPRTDNNLFNESLRQPYHLAGYGASVHFYPKVFLGDHVFIQPNVKYGYINMPDVFIETGLATNEKISQHFTFLQYGAVIGYSFRISDPERKKIAKSDSLNK